jgi:hypothetical protein
MKITRTAAIIVRYAEVPGSRCARCCRRTVTRDHAVIPERLAALDGTGPVT